MTPIDRYIAQYRSIVESMPRDEALKFIEDMLCVESAKAVRDYLKQAYLELKEADAP